MDKPLRQNHHAPLGLTNKRIIRLHLVSAVIFTGFWIYFFLVENHDPAHTIVYLAFERSFWFPDLFWIVPLLLLTAIFSLRKNPQAIVTAAAAGGALVFLGLADLSFCVQYHTYYKTPADAIIFLVIGSLCIMSGALSIAYSWKMIAFYKGEGV